MKYLSAGEISYHPHLQRNKRPKGSTHAYETKNTAVNEIQAWNEDPNSFNTTFPGQVGNKNLICPHYSYYLWTEGE